MQMTINQLLAEIKKEAALVENQMYLDLNELRPVIDHLLAEILDYGLFNGGKRIRPLLVVFASRLCGNNGDDEVYRLACAFEYLHAATLFHDDIIDSSDTRRGSSTVNRKFGTTEAILAGDFLHAYAMSIVGQFSGNEGIRVFCEATTGMVDGEFMQLRHCENHNLSELDYHGVIMGKTGLLISAACVIGAMYGGGDREQILAMQTYGENLGCAFQIIDDLLDYQGDPSKTGKAVGNDLIEGKMTLPLILTLNNAADADKKYILAILADIGRRGESVDEVCGLIEKYNGFTLAREKAEAAVVTACSALQIFHKTALFESELLEGLANYVLTRQN
jgi:octaprenyl-diphosphate synthase